MKLICYSLFYEKAEPFEMASYVRGFYFNARMNNLIYPDWRTHLEVDKQMYSVYGVLLDWLVANNNLSLHVNNQSGVPLCEGMFWRMKPIFQEDVTHVLCRDCDSITTYREALAVQTWLESNKRALSLNDNPAHSGMMGGMVGFVTAFLKGAMEVHTFEQLISGFDLTLRGSDQHLLNQRILPRIKDDLMSMGSIWGPQIPDMHSQAPLPQVAPKLWESNLTCRHIGSAGVVEMEVLRFFKRMDEYNWKFAVIESQFPKLFYWRNP